MEMQGWKKKLVTNELKARGLPTKGKEPALSEQSRDVLR